MNLGISTSGAQYQLIQWWSLNQSLTHGPPRGQGLVFSHCHKVKTQWTFPWFGNSTLQHVSLISPTFSLMLKKFCAACSVQEAQRISLVATRDGTAGGALRSCEANCYYNLFASVIGNLTTFQKQTQNQLYRPNTRTHTRNLTLSFNNLQEERHTVDIRGQNKDKTEQK